MLPPTTIPFAQEFLPTLSTEDLEELNRLEGQLRAATKEQAELRSAFDAVSDTRNQLDTLLNDNLKKRLQDLSTQISKTEMTIEEQADLQQEKTSELSAVTRQVQDKDGEQSELRGEKTRLDKETQQMVKELEALKEDDLKDKNLIDRSDKVCLRDVFCPLSVLAGIFMPCSISLIYVLVLTKSLLLVWPSPCQLCSNSLKDYPLLTSFL
jgi:DNA repair exonuclease SbcCD ATPase subunit